MSEFIYAQSANAPDYMIRGGVKYKLLKNHLGSVLSVVNSSTGAVTQSLTYSLYGKVLSDSNPGFQPFGFAGGLYDPDTGLVRFGAREYNAEIGRWTTKDPILFNGGDTNLFGYVMNDPVNWVDPTGLITWADVGKHAGTGLSTGIVVGGATGLLFTPATGLSAGLGTAGLVTAGLILNQLLDETFRDPMREPTSVPISCGQK